jgi:hypothetical protein
MVAPLSAQGCRRGVLAENSPAPLSCPRPACAAALTAMGAGSRCAPAAAAPRAAAQVRAHRPGTGPAVLLGRPWHEAALCGSAGLFLQVSPQQRHCQRACLSSSRTFDVPATLWELGMKLRLENEAPSAARPVNGTAGDCPAISRARSDRSTKSKFFSFPSNAMAARFAASPATTIAMRIFVPPAHCAMPSSASAGTTGCHPASGQAAGLGGPHGWNHPMCGHEGPVRRPPLHRRPRDRGQGPALPGGIVGRVCAQRRSCGCFSGCRGAALASLS